MEKRSGEKQPYIQTSTPTVSFERISEMLEKQREDQAQNQKSEMLFMTTDVLI